MKTNTYIKTLLCTFLICLVSSAFAITDEEVVQSLESLGDLETAYPFAYKLAQKQNTYTAWRDMAAKYAKFDTDEKAYLQAWQFAHTLNQKSIYQDFLKIKSQSPLNKQAIHAIFKLVMSSSKPGTSVFAGNCLSSTPKDFFMSSIWRRKASRFATL